MSFAHNKESAGEELLFDDDLRQMAAARNYLEWQYGLIQPYLGKSILEIGAGIGNFTVRLVEQADRVVGIEPDERCYERNLARTGQQEGVRLLRGFAEDLDSLLDAGELFDTVVCLNVLEHIEDDGRTASKLAKRLVEGGRFVVQVPACPWAFGEIDRSLGHYRRYSRWRLRVMIEAAGLSVGSMRYFNAAGVLAWWWNARVTRIRRQSDLQIAVFDKILVPVMSRIERVIPPLFGQSLFAVGEKTHHGCDFNLRRCQRLERSH